MKQFQKYGVAAAVASLAAGAVAQEVSKNESGDLAIIPYYTVLDGKNTGMHIINTTDNTQVVKVRLRRGADSRDSLDFNLVMSPRDEWTANIGENPNGDGVIVTTNDSTCTVPEFPAGGAVMPSTYAEGAEEGYAEIIAMGQPTTEGSHIAVAAKHQTATTGMPLDCDTVRDHFFRVPAATVDGVVGGTSNLTRGTHSSNLLSSGFCTAASTYTAGTLCVTTASNLSIMADADNSALKVSYFITDSSGGLEAGDNAVHVTGFSTAPMMTNQQPLSFGTAGILRFDPLNFELPNLAYGAYESSNATRIAAGADGASLISSGDLYDRVRQAMDSAAVINDWASFEAADGSTVAADWVVTLPGQYTMNNPICDMYAAYSQSLTACNTAQTLAAAAAGGDELPLTLASSTSGDPLAGGASRLALWDREEMRLTNPETPSDDELGFSPGGSAGDPTQNAVLNREVNVISWNDNSSLNTAASQTETLGLGVAVSVPGDADRGWGQLTIDPATAAVGTVDFGGIVNDDADLTPALGSTAATNPVARAPDTAVAAIAVWQRSFAEQAGNYGRIVEHSTVVSSGSLR